MIKNTTLIIDAIKYILSMDDRVLFAYLYGSFETTKEFNDIDIAVYMKENSDFFQTSSDIKVRLSKITGHSPDIFDIQAVNHIPEKGDLFSLIFLKNVFDKNKLLVDKALDTRTDFIERYSMKYRECEGLFDEVLA